MDEKELKPEELESVSGGGWDAAAEGEDSSLRSTALQYGLPHEPEHGESETTEIGFEWGKGISKQEAFRTQQDLGREEIRRKIGMLG